MKCPLCNLEAHIKASRYVVENDTNEDETKLFLEQDIACMNSKCNNFQKIIHTFRNPIKLG